MVMIEAYYKTGFTHYITHTVERQIMGLLFLFRSFPILETSWLSRKLCSMIHAVCGLKQVFSYRIERGLV